MSETPSSLQMKIGTPAPDFTLPDSSGGTMVSLSDFAGAPALLVMFICNHCPYVKHILDSLIDVSRRLMEHGLAVAAINSNDTDAYPDDSPQQMAELVKDKGIPFPYLFDRSQEIAKAYGAACTPDFFLFDKNRKLAYRGQFDESRPGNDIAPTGKDLVSAAGAVLAGEQVPGHNRPSIGCNIKWRPGNEPDYAGS